MDASWYLIREMVKDQAGVTDDLSLLVIPVHDHSDVQDFLLEPQLFRVEVPRFVEPDLGDRRPGRKFEATSHDLLVGHPEHQWIGILPVRTPVVQRVHTPIRVWIALEDTIVWIRCTSNLDGRDRILEGFECEEVKEALASGSFQMIGPPIRIIIGPRMIVRDANIIDHAPNDHILRIEDVGAAFQRQEIVALRSDVVSVLVLEEDQTLNSLCEGVRSFIEPPFFQKGQAVYKVTIE